MALIKGKQIKGNSVALDRIELLTAQRVLITDGNGQLQEREVSGDATIGLTGALTVSPNAINAGKIADGSITFAKLNAAAISSDLSSSCSLSSLFLSSFLLPLPFFRLPEPLLADSLRCLDLNPPPPPALLLALPGARCLARVEPRVAAPGQRGSQ